jgi:hypothetical protein
MDIQAPKISIKERAAKTASSLQVWLVNMKVKIKAWFVNTKAKIMLWPRKKKLIALVIVALVVGGIVYAAVRPFSITNKMTPKEVQAQKEYDILFKGKTNITAKMGDTVNLGTLKIDFYNVKESSYLSFDKDSNGNRITKRYLAAQISVQNLHAETSDIILIGLKDGRGNSYLLDYSVPFYVADTRDFGRNMVMYPRTITDGYIFFADVDEKADNLELVVAITSSKEKAAFKFERKAK